ncbi:hypothetical protein VOLCADRAFT_89632 [Volvox carteri f. nagariensis]|uniref:Uncharacterized protein n=1 Tax=Volvox carteri f. nagariensis TaxID=3068 RepID=D8TSC9_VOLCA|nr:uncharacterized protein VOLCADRAFT_89632 [Volvox carteri f. nagariensis]EFJ49673.1 hypothetical protein VOLCADRAFT_89632 [Volvox carteri f. nagariensis]|eukprot:XP_002949180.1 hypothetical protein VOLCADRAFT_89632 [Volvox carteri f. nagariensis]
MTTRDPSASRPDESDRPSESVNAAFRDVMLTRLAALESEVQQLRAAGSRQAGGGDRKMGLQQGRKAADGGTQEHVAAAAAPGAEGVTKGKEASGGDNTGNQGSTTEAVAEELSKLHPKIVRLVHSGYLESLHHLRQRLMVDEWEGGGRQRALQRGVAEFEGQWVEKRVELGWEEWEELSQLYKDPENLEVIRDPRVRSAARATLQRVLDERHEKVREAATHLAKELADGVANGPGNLISGLLGLLPLPGFLKGK